MKQLFCFLLGCSLLAGFMTACGRSNSNEVVLDENALRVMEQGRIKTLTSRVAVLDSLIEAYNKSVPADLEIEQFYFDSTYLKMFHGEKFNEKFISIVTAIEAKEASVLTSIRANKIMPHEK
ncbi:MAG: hypothetical protein IJ151_01250 [Bacteroidales bacterium]|nr:hypothetical protein [Bacteroidales bacterium]